MSNYALTVNSTFQPFSYQELMAPVAAMSQAHEKIATEYDKLSSQADVLEAMGKNDRDVKDGTYARYKAYSDALRKEADDLYRYGLNTESRRRLTDLRRMYNTDIVPIQNAWEKRKSENDMQTQARLKNPSLRFTREASETPLGEYIANPNSSFGVINLDSIAKDMSIAASNLSKQIRGGYNVDIDEFTKNHITQFGLDPQLVSEWIANPSKSAALTNMMQQVLKKHGVTSEMVSSNPSLFTESMQAAQMGAWSAVGEDKEQKYEDFKARKDYIPNSDNTNPNSIEDDALPGETIPLNFNDPESAGENMKAKLADATAKVIERYPNNPYSRKIQEYWKDKGGLEAAKEHWAINGLNGDDIGRMDKNGLYYTLGNYIRRNITQNENIINIWRSGYAESPKASSKDDASSYVRNNYGGLDYNGNPISESTYNSMQRNPGNGNVKGVAPGTKDWKNFDNESSTGFRVNMVSLKENQEAVGKYLERILTKGIGTKLPLYDIKKISGKGEYTYSKERLDRSELPTNESGKSIDYSKIYRNVLSNGDYLLTWVDKDGKTVQKVLRRKDIGEQAERDWERIKPQYNAIKKMRKDNRISKEEYETLEKALLIKSTYDAYMDLEEVDVKDKTIGGK